jgi:beta-glucanase (GH16 family)
MNTNTSPTQTTFQYGRIEAREKLPVGAGLWPAFWALGSNFATVPWPGCGEMDFMENAPASAGLGPTLIRSTIHGPGYSGANGLGFDSLGPAIDVTTFHSYGAIWSPYMVQFYVDDPSKPFFVVTASDVPGGSSQWAFNHAFIAITNLAVGGSFPGPPDATTPSPAVMLVDYVRYYQAAPVPAPKLGNPPGITVKAGATTGNTSTINLSSVSGSGMVYLACSTDAPKASCAVFTNDIITVPEIHISPSVVDFTRSSTASATVTVTTTASSMLPPIVFDPRVQFWAPIIFALIVMLVLALTYTRARSPEWRWRHGVALAGLVGAMILIASCGTASNCHGCGTCGLECANHQGTSPGVYTVTVNAYTVDGNGTNPDATVPIVLTVN